MTPTPPTPSAANLEELEKEASERLREILSGVMTPLIDAYSSDLKTIHNEVAQNQECLRSARANADRRLEFMEKVTGELGDDATDQKETIAAVALRTSYLESRLSTLAAEQETLRTSLRRQSILLLLALLGFVVAMALHLKK